MSYNIYATVNDDSLLTGPFENGIWRTAPTELLDSILSGQNYSEAHYNYDRTYNNGDVLREQVIAVIENRNKAYLQLLAFATNGFLEQLPEIIRQTDEDAGYYDDWEAINITHASSNFTVDELISLEPQLSVDLEDAPDAIGAYSPETLQVIIGFVSRMRSEYTVDPALRHVDFSIG